MAMVLDTDVTAYFLHDAVMNQLWANIDSSSGAEQAWQIQRAEAQIARCHFVGRKSVKTQTEPFPRNMEDVLSNIASYKYDRDNYDDIYQSYYAIDGIIPVRVKNAVCEQIKHNMLTDDFLMEDKVLQKFAGTVKTGNADFRRSKGESFVCEMAFIKLNPFIVKYQSIYEVFEDD